MNADEARAALAGIQEWSRLYWEDNPESATAESLAFHVRHLTLALLDEPVPADEREALANALDAADDAWQHGVGEYPDQWSRDMADAILAAGFRRQGPITDELRSAILEAAGWLRSDGHPTLAGRLYAALEAAEAERDGRE